MSDKFNTKPILLMLVLLLSGCHLKSIKNHAIDPDEGVETKNSSTIEPGTIVPESPDAKTNTTTAEPAETITVSSEPQTAPVEPVVKPVEKKPVHVTPVHVTPVHVTPVPVEPKPTEPVKPVKPKEKTAITVTKAVETPVKLTLRGQIVLDQSQLTDKSAELKNTIVYFEPANHLITQLPLTDAVISTRNKEFKPNVLAITTGSTINFPNMDRILHNVFSVSPSSEFDLGLYSAGLSRDVVFNKPGIIYVHCNVHHSMQADILVLDTPYFTRVNDDGSFELNNIPELAGTLNVWHPRGNIKSLPINENSQHQNIKQSLVITRPEVPKHSNKFGKAYRRTRY